MKDKPKQIEMSTHPKRLAKPKPFWKGGLVKGKRYFRQHVRWSGTGRHRYAELDTIAFEVYRVRRKDGSRMWRMYSYMYDERTGVERLLNRLVVNRWEEIQPDWLRVDEGL